MIDKLLTGTGNTALLQTPLKFLSLLKGEEEVSDEIESVKEEESDVVRCRALRSLSA